MGDQRGTIARAVEDAESAGSRPRSARADRTPSGAGPSGTVADVARLDLGRRAATMHRLQRSLGNAAVARALGPRPGSAVLARYEAGEHAALGSPGKTIKVGDVEVTEAELSAMGDFYASPEKMLEDATNNKAKFEKLLADIRSDRDLRAQGKDGIEESTWIADTAHRVKDEQYLDLAGNNAAHFAPGKRGANHKARWEGLHKQALEVAHAAAATDKQVPDEARRINGFASHFVTDAFSAGHLAAKQDLMDTAQAKFDALPVTGNIPFTNKLGENSFSKALASGMLANPKIAPEFAKRELKIIDFGDFTQKRTSELIFGLRLEEPQLFFSLFARTVHDNLDDAIRGGAAKGLEVTNDNGDVWTLAGDATLNLSADTRAIASKAVEASRANLAIAASTPGPLDFDALFKNVWRFTPRPTTKAQHDAAVTAKAKADLPKPPAPAGLKSPRWGSPPNDKLKRCFEDKDRLGDHDPDTDAVKRVQQALLELKPITGKSYDLGPTGADGVYGSLTAAAIRKFKKDQDLGSEQFGDVGPRTMDELDRLFMGAAPKPPPGPVLKPGSREGSAQMDEAVITFTDPGKQETVNAIVKLAADKLDALLAKLDEKGRIRLKKNIPGGTPAGP
jgi:peptidoglycan hydrolase-like protein with peptidoglycan-binding domain